jgi:hypothetical protein
MSYNSPERPKKIIDPKIHNAALARREAPFDKDPSRRRDPNAHLRGPRNEYGLIIPSDNIENYIPGLNDYANYTMNNIRTGKPVTAYAKRQMNLAKDTYKAQRNTAINKAQRNIAINNANRMDADPRWKSKRSKTEHKRKRKARKTRRKN